MAKVLLNETPFDIDLVAFDKDGTLIDFYHLWGYKAQRCVDALMQQVEGHPELGEQLYKSLGYDTETNRAASDGPLATAPIPKIKTIATTVLYQHGFGWDDAEKHVRESFALGMDAIPTADLVRPRNAPRAARCSRGHATALEPVRARRRAADRQRPHRALRPAAPAGMAVRRPRRP